MTHSFLHSFLVRLKINLARFHKVLFTPSSSLLDIGQFFKNFENMSKSNLYFARPHGNTCINLG